MLHNLFFLELCCPTSIQIRMLIMFILVAGYTRCVQFDLGKIKNREVKPSMLHNFFLLNCDAQLQFRGKKKTESEREGKAVQKTKREH